MPVENYTDENVSRFFQELGIASEHKPHVLKIAKAALNSDLFTHGRRHFHDEPTYWKQSLIEFKVLLSPLLLLLLLLV